MFCEKCGNGLAEGASFCSACGERVSAKPHNSESTVICDVSKDVRRHESDIHAAGPESTSSDNAKKPVSRKKLALIVVAIALAVVVIAVIVVRALTGSDTSQSEQDPIVGDWTVVVNQSDVEISFEVREDGSFALTKPLPGGKFLGIPMDGDGWNDLVSGLRWERGPFEGGVQRYRLRFDGDLASVLGSAAVFESTAIGLDINAFVRDSTLEFWVPLGFPESADGEWGFCFAPAFHDASWDGLLEYAEIEMRFDLDSQGEINCWRTFVPSDGAPPEESQFALGKWSETANHDGTSDAALSVKLNHEEAYGVEVDFSPKQVR